MKQMLLLGMLLCLPFVACNADVEGPVSPTLQPIELNANEKEMATRQGDFASTLSLELYRQLGEKTDNWMVSPFSLQCALGMLSNGANGETREEILHALGLSQYSQEEVNAYFRKLIEGLSTVNSAIAVKTANSIWGNAGVSFKDDFQKTNIENYAATVSQLDFSDPSAVDQINDWFDPVHLGRSRPVCHRVSVEFLVLQGSVGIRVRPRKDTTGRLYHLFRRNGES